MWFMEVCLQKKLLKEIKKLNVFYEFKWDIKQS